jgi:hypothetical protein
MKRETSTSEERQLMLVEVEKIHETLMKYVQVQKSAAFTLSSSSLVRDALTLLNDVRDFVRKVDQVKVAKAYHLVGPPKVGKSTIAPLILEQACLARGVPYRPEDNAQLNLLAAYQDEIENTTQTITINETLPVKEVHAKSVENAYNTSLALVDPVPFHPNRSSLEDKSRVTFQGIFILSTGNKSLPFRNVAQTQGAWARRYHIIAMRVLPQYADEFGRFDSSKADGTNDYHVFDIYEIVFDETDREEIVYFTHNGKKTKDLNTREMLSFIRAACIKHYEEQDLLEKRRQEAKATGCLVCKNVAQFCVCVDDKTYVTTPQKLGQETASVMTLANPCEKRTQMEGKGKPCVFFAEDGVSKCKYCETVLEEEAEENEAEMGILGVATSTASSLAWSAISPWINPFTKMAWIWSIDNAVSKVMYEDLVEELSYIPDKIGTSILSLTPESWETRADGTKSFWGKRKEQFITLLAADKQMFMHLTYYLRIALTLGVIVLLFAFALN